MKPKTADGNREGLLNRGEPVRRSIAPTGWATERLFSSAISTSEAVAATRSQFKDPELAAVAEGRLCADGPFGRAGKS